MMEEGGILMLVYFNLIGRNADKVVGRGALSVAEKLTYA